MYLFFFFFNDTATTEIYTLSLHDALPIWGRLRRARRRGGETNSGDEQHHDRGGGQRPAPIGTLEAIQPFNQAIKPVISHIRPDRKSTRLNSSHSQISYAVFCLKKKKNLYIYMKKHLDIVSHVLEGHRGRRTDDNRCGDRDSFDQPKLHVTSARRKIDDLFIKR